MSAATLAFDPARSWAAEGVFELPGAGLALLWGLPFAGLLLSIAIFPLIAPKFWHAHFGKMTAVWSAAFLAPCLMGFGVAITLHELLYVLLLEYVPFMGLLLALYAVGGGIRIKGGLGGTPIKNTALLAFGAAIAGWIGTTGACMVLVHALLRANEWRKRRTHIVVFFIFIVGNIGGSLSPLGDPPLFIGFLKGVDFFWPTVNLFWPTTLCLAMLLPAFYALDRTMLAREGAKPPVAGAGEKPGIEGVFNLALLATAVGAVLASGALATGRGVSVSGVLLSYENIARTAALLAIAALSVRFTPAGLRQANNFTWFPMVEVAKLFAGIFITIVPVIAILKAGENGAAAPLIALLHPGAAPDNAMYFWITGLLSAFLDNAPTYLVFFNVAGGDPQALMAKFAVTLQAISCGAVFMGALSYIGNAPNFMVKAIAEERGVAMPSFFAYVGWAAAFLALPFLLVTLVFFR